MSDEPKMRPIYFLVLNNSTVWVMEYNVRTGTVKGIVKALKKAFTDRGMWAVLLHPKAAEILGARLGTPVQLKGHGLSADESVAMLEDDKGCTP